MKIFGINTGGGGNFKITYDDRAWVEENFSWLKRVFGYPNPKEEPILINPKSFPATFSTPDVKLENVVQDLCSQFHIPRDIIRYQVHTDIRDFNVPYEIEGTPFECETVLKKGDYTIFIANSLLNHPQRLVYSLIYEFIRIHLTEHGLEFDVGGDDTGLFIYIAGVYYGYGIILAQNLLHAGRSSDGVWEIKWNYGAEMPLQVMAFSLALFANLQGSKDPVWKNEFKGDFKRMFEDALAYLQKHPTDHYDEMEIKANNFFDEANEQFDNNDLDGAISTLQKILFITDDDILKADVYNNMGYYYLRRKNYPQGISSFRKALVLGPEYGYANDNLGYALIMSGELEEGYTYVEKAMSTGNNDVAYTFRNFALYHQYKGNNELAEEFFQNAFDQMTPVDLLEFHYGQFLLERGDTDRAKEFFQKSADKKEGEGIEKLRTV